MGVVLIPLVAKWYSTVPRREVFATPGYSTTDIFGGGSGGVTWISLNDASAPISIHITNTPPNSTFTPLKSRMNCTRCSLLFVIPIRDEYYVVIDNPHSIVVKMQLFLDIFEPISFWGFVGLSIVLFGVGVFLGIYSLHERRKNYILSP